MFWLQVTVIPADEVIKRSEKKPGDKKTQGKQEQSHWPTVRVKIKHFHTQKIVDVQIDENLHKWQL